MNLTLIRRDFLIADKDLQCAAFEMWMKIARGREYDSRPLWERTKLVCAAFKTRFGIQTGDDYIHYEFVDGDTGGVLEMDCAPHMDLEMIKTDSYPPFILSEIKKHDYKIRHPYD